MGNSSLERWKEIDGYNGVYFVSDQGRVMSKFRGERILKPSINNAGYLKINLGRHNSLDIHRLVAKEFLPNHGNKRDVNHKNGNKLDNRVENLEWITNKDNQLHGFYKLGHHGLTRPIRCIETGKIYQSAQQAGRELNICSRNISQAAQPTHRVKSAGGYHWERLSH